MWERKWPMNFAWNARLPRSIQGSFTCRKSTTWDRRLYFPSEGRRAEDFFTLKNPTASDGFEPANLGTKGQHATSRPPKPLVALNIVSFIIVVYDVKIYTLIHCLLNARGFDRSCNADMLPQHATGFRSHVVHCIVCSLCRR